MHARQPVFRQPVAQARSRDRDSGPGLFFYGFRELPARNAGLRHLPPPSELSKIVRYALLVPIAVAAFFPATTARAQTTALAMLNDGTRELRTSSIRSTDPTAGMLSVPAGEVSVGTSRDDIEYLGDKNDDLIAQYMAEVPRHIVNVEAFHIDRTEITSLQWKIFLDATGREPSEYVADYCWGGTEIPEGGELLPITNVSFADVMDYLAWAGKRLPTEAEWTLAARGSADARKYPWGENWDASKSQNSSAIPSAPVAVGSFPDGASAFGALDMCGNVWEWVNSPYSAFDGFEPWRKNSSRKSKSISPEFNRSFKVAKGGSFATARNDMRIDMRMSVHPSENDASLGFRAALSAQPGVDVITHSYSRLLPPAVVGISGLDLSDVVSEELTTYLVDDTSIITGHRYLTFAHPAARKGSGLSKLRKVSRDEPVTLGILTTSESLQKPVLPPGDYLLAYKGIGESKAHKAKRKAEKKNGSSKKNEEPTPPPVDDAAGGPAGASAPWPGVNVASIIEDIEFPQDKDVILFYNVNSAVVGYTLLPDAREQAKSPAVMADKGKGKAWTIEFSLDNMPRNKKMPRFTIQVELYGEGLKG